MFAACYRVLGYFGLMLTAAALIWGFRHESDAPWRNYANNLLLYLAFVAPHLVMFGSLWKLALW
jgi:hypothetical protein